MSCFELVPLRSEKYFKPCNFQGFQRALPSLSHRSSTSQKTNNKARRDRERKNLLAAFCCGKKKKCSDSPDIFRFIHHYSVINRFGRETVIKFSWIVVLSFAWFVGGNLREWIPKVTWALYCFLKSQKKNLKPFLKIYSTLEQYERKYPKTNNRVLMGRLSTSRCCCDDDISVWPLT